MAISLLGAFFGYPGEARAYVSQPEKGTAIGALPPPNNRFELGNGLNGRLTDIDLSYFSDTQYYAGRVTAELWECSFATYQGCRTIISVDRTGPNQGDIAFSSGDMDVDPCKYYELLLTKSGSPWGIGGLNFNGSGQTPYYVLRGVDRLAAPRTCANPVLIIPGLLGSGMRSGAWVMDPIFHSYDGLFGALEGAGYVASSTLFTFPYDWRRSNAETAQLLRAKIDSIKSACACSKIDVVAHSMGGLVARAYAQSAGYRDDIGKLIFLGTPHRGAPEVYPVWEAGELRSNGLSNWVLKLLLSYEARKQGYKSFFSYIRDLPVRSIQELLPIYDYLKPADGSAARRYPDGHPANPFLAGLGAGLGDFLQLGIPVTNIVSATDASTASAVLTVPRDAADGKWKDGFAQGYESGAGDGTVPLSSSSLGDDVDRSVDAGHMELPTKSEALVIDALSETEFADNSTPLPSVISITFGNSNVTQDIAQSFSPPSDSSLASIDLYIKKTGSPADIVVRIASDVGGIPGSDPIAQTTLSASRLARSYSWQKIRFSDRPALTAGKKYWIVLDAQSSPTGYYIAASNLYFAEGEARIGRNDTAHWFGTSPSDQSVYFKAVMARLPPAAVMPHRTIRSMLAAMVFSPVDIMVTAPDGKRIGRDPATGVELNEIPDAYYSGIGSEDELVTIPNPIDGEYAVTALGNGTGTFSIELAAMTDDTLATSTLSGTTTPGEIATFNVQVDEAGISDAIAPPQQQQAPAPVTPEIQAEATEASPSRVHASRTPQPRVVPETVAETEMLFDISLDRFIRGYKNYKPASKIVDHVLMIEPARQNTASAYFSFGAAWRWLTVYIKHLLRL